ncbi:MAG TPA: DtxR family transcriptional regulator [Ruminococcaceae bacterium]|nr:DtxR family transcriptional regulator [Oscillospiraceae bacterium]HCA30363.1 DtxR family transcriptional regulator [Oscillospiraceae bacterium]
MKIHESGENYLETILLLRKKSGYVRAVDVANQLKYSKPSVSRALGILKSAGLVSIESSGNILLTPAGERRAAEIYERHRVITEFLVLTLGISSDIAAEDACRIEHIISPDTFNRIREYVEKRN